MGGISVAALPRLSLIALPERLMSLRGASLLPGVAMGWILVAALPRLSIIALPVLVMGLRGVW